MSSFSDFLSIANVVPLLTEYPTTEVNNPKLVLIVGCVGFTLNVISASFLHEHDHDHTASTSADQPIELQGPDVSPFPRNSHDAHRHETRSRSTSGKSYDLGLIGVLVHVAGDAANNLGVIIAGAVIWKSGFEARYYADPAVSMAISFMILLSSLPLIKRSGTILLESVPLDVDPQDVKHDLETVPGVVTVHELHLWRLNQQKAIASAHVVVESLSDFMQLAKTINACLHAYGIHSATLQPELVPSFTTINERTSDVAGAVQKRVHAGTTCQIGCRTTGCEQLTCCE